MKIGIIGSGFVGSAAAFELVMSGIAHEIVLIDKDVARAGAEAIDICHASPCACGSRIYSGDYEDLSGAEIVIITAGANQKPGQTRLDLLRFNATIFKEIIPQIVKSSPNAILLVASNPADIMAEITLKLSGFDPSRVICSGTVLDSLRFQSELAAFFGVSSKSITAHVVGEHGDHEVLLWSKAKVEAMDLEEFSKEINKPLTAEAQRQIDDNVRNAAYKIIEGKRATFYGIAGALTRICQAIASDSNAILPVSSHHSALAGAHDLYLSMPTIVNRFGVVKVLHPRMSAEEQAALEKSANVIEGFTRQILAEL